MSSSALKSARKEQRERDEFEHKAIMDTWGSVNDGLYKLATMSFSFNGGLVAIVTFVAGNSDKVSPIFLRCLIGVVGFMGIIYNLGAFFHFLSNAAAQSELGPCTRELEKRLEIKAYRAVRNSTFLKWHLRCGALTYVFFFLFIVGWILFSLLAFNPDASGGATQCWKT